MATKRKKSETKNKPTSGYLARLEIENIRCFGPRQTLDLLDASGEPARWTVILGPNSVGKTTLLQCIAGIMPKLPRTSDDSRIWTAANQIFPFMFLDNFGREISEEWGKVSGQYWTHPKDRNKNALNPGNFHTSLSFGPHIVERIGGGTDWAVSCFAYGVTRQATRQGFSDVSQDSSGLETLFDTNALLINAEDWLLRLDYAERRKARQVKNLTFNVLKALIALLPLIDNIRIYEDVDSTNVCVQFHTKFGWVRFGQLGHGYQTMIGWVVDLASRMFKAYPDSKDPLSEAAVVLVDEIDLHMHPEWQRKIMGYLSERFPKVQFIATAHSPLIVQGADENTNIAVLRREGDHVVIDNDPENVRNWRVDQILASDLFSVEGRRSSDTDDLLAKRRKILSKPKLTKKDRAKVEEIEEQVGYLPGEETVEDREAWEIVRRAADRLKKQNTAAE